MPSGLVTTKTTSYTLRYASPELVRGETLHTLASDVWAWGCLLFFVSLPNVCTSQCLISCQIFTDKVPYYMKRVDCAISHAISQNEHPADLSTVNAPPIPKEVLAMCWEPIPGSRSPMSRHVERLSATLPSIRSTPPPSPHKHPHAVSDAPRTRRLSVECPSSPTESSLYLTALVRCSLWPTERRTNYACLQNETVESFEHFDVPTQQISLARSSAVASGGAGKPYRGVHRLSSAFPDSNPRHTVSIPLREGRLDEGPLLGHYHPFDRPPKVVEDGPPPIPVATRPIDATRLQKNDRWEPSGVIQPPIRLANVSPTMTSRKMPRYTPRTKGLKPLPFPPLPRFSQD